MYQALGLAGKLNDMLCAVIDKGWFFCLVESEGEDDRKKTDSETWQLLQRAKKLKALMSWNGTPLITTECNQLGDGSPEKVTMESAERSFREAPTARMSGLPVILSAWGYSRPCLHWFKALQLRVAFSSLLCRQTMLSCRGDFL